MYETVKVVNGHAITRVVGTRKFYYVNINKHSYRTFNTKGTPFCPNCGAKMKGGAE